MVGNTVDALKNLYKTLCGSDYAGNPNPTDAEMIDAIAKDASSGGGESGGSSIVIKQHYVSGSEGMTIDSIAPGLSMDDLLDAKVEAYEKDDPDGEESCTGIGRISSVLLFSNNGLMIRLNLGTSAMYYNPETGEIATSY